MDEILQKLVPLLIGSVPTMIIFLFLVIAYKFLLHGPLLKVLAERRQRTEGAIERAHAAIAAAEAKAQEYEARLRTARNEIFHARESRVAAWTSERDATLATARQVAREQIQTAKTALEGQAQASRLEIEHKADELASAVLSAVLPSGRASGNTLLAEGSH